MTRLRSLPGQNPKTSWNHLAAVRFASSGLMYFARWWNSSVHGSGAPAHFAKPSPFVQYRWIRSVALTSAGLSSRPATTIRGGQPSPCDWRFGADFLVPETAIEGYALATLRRTSAR